MKFSDLNEQDRVQCVKDGFVLILEKLSRYPSEINKYYNIEKPKTIIPCFEQISDSLSEEDKKIISERNEKTILSANEINASNKKKYEESLEQFKKAEEIIKSLSKKEGCVCGSCIELDIINNIIPTELQFLIDFARKEAEARIY